jgi:hypothetical protein
MRERERECFAHGGLTGGWLHYIPDINHRSTQLHPMTSSIAITTWPTPVIQSPPLVCVNKALEVNNTLIIFFMFLLSVYTVLQLLITCNLFFGPSKTVFLSISKAKPRIAKT